MTASQDIAKAMGDHLNQFAWTHWVTLTPRFPDCTPAKLVKEFQHRFIRHIAQAAQCPVSWFYTLEQSESGVYHLHALLGATEALSVEQVCHAWQLGISEAATYSRSGGASWYLTKTLGQTDKQWEHFDLSRRMPPRILQHNQL